MRRHAVKAAAVAFEQVLLTRVEYDALMRRDVLDDAHVERTSSWKSPSRRSLARDRSKAHPYAAAGVDEYWIVNLTESVIEVYREPGSDGYGRITRHARGSEARPVRFPELGVPTTDVLPPWRYRSGSLSTFLCRSSANLHACSPTRMTEDHRALPTD